MRLEPCGTSPAGTFLGIKWRMANYEADEENKRNAGTAKAAGTKRPRPGSLPTAPVAAPGAPPFSPAALAGKALIYGTSLAVGTTLAAVAGFCYVNDIKSVSSVVAHSAVRKSLFLVLARMCKNPLNQLSPTSVCTAYTYAGV